jgi:hypothetical protein
MSEAPDIPHEQWTVISSAARERPASGGRNVRKRRYVELCSSNPTEFSVGTAHKPSREGDCLAPSSGGHWIRDGHHVAAKPVLGGLHHEYHLKPMAA